MVRDALVTQKRELQQRLQEPYVDRQFGIKQREHDLIKVIIGPRRAGKSLSAMHMVAGKEPFGYVNFDDERLVDLREYDGLLAAVESVYERPKRLLLDEIQNLPRWELLVNRLQRQGYDLTVTGSNAHLLSSELATHLTGRHIPIILFPFSFSEYLSASRKELTDVEKAEALRRYAEEGGYPEPLMKQVNRREYLTTLVRSVLYKDIVVRCRIRAVQGLNDLATYLMANIAREYSLNSLARLTQCRGARTVEKYLRGLEESFLFFSLRRFSYKVREQARANRKIYCIDNGLVTSASFRFSADQGRLYENLVAIALHKRELEGDLEVFFWKNREQEEVDFVVKEGTRITQLIQVCLALDGPNTRERELRALLKASAELKCANLLVVTDSAEGEEQVSWYGLNGTVKFMPLWKWLLGPGKSAPSGRSQS